jgi:SAM-dependent methyltransferase
MTATAQRLHSPQFRPARKTPPPVASREEAVLATLRRLGVIRKEELTRALMNSMFRGIDLKGRRVLDIGGGDGMYSFYAAGMGAAEVVCLEPEAAGSHGEEANIFARIQAELPELPVRLVERGVADFHDSEGFDVVVMIASINHVDEEACIRLLEEPQAKERYRQLFRHIASLTRPGGRIVIADCTRHNFYAALGLTNPLCRTIEWHKHQAPQTWAGVLQTAGFCKPRISWEPLYRMGPLVQALLANKVAAWFLKSCFRLEMQRSPGSA